MLQMVCHGGHCCGIKQIFGLPYRPDYETPALEQKRVTHGASAEMSPGARFYPGPEPAETGIVRLDKLLVYIDERKKAHLVEIVLNMTQTTYWRESLEKRGFKEVSKFQNSNTDSVLYVFHRVTPLPSVPEKQAK